METSAMRMFRSTVYWVVVPFVIATLLHMFLPRSLNFPLTAGVGCALLAMVLAQWARFARRLPRRAPLARAAVPVTGFLGTLSLAAAGVVMAAGGPRWTPFLAFAGCAFLAAAAVIGWYRLSGVKAQSS
jgi:hypothetical protein